MQKSPDKCTFSGCRINFIITFSIVILWSAVSAQSVVVQTESFESSIFPCPGWKQLRGITSQAGNFTRQTTAGSANPAVPVDNIAPGNGASTVLMFNSFAATAGDTSILISKPFDFSNNGGTNPVMFFDMYRDNGFAGNNDRVEVFINTSPTMTGATPVNHQFASHIINRNNTLAPSAVANSWNRYTFSLNAAFYSQRRYYFLIRAICADGNNMYFDRFTVNTYPGTSASADVSMDLVSQNQSSVGTGSINQWVVGVRCIIGGTSGCGNINLGSALKLDSLLFNTNGTTNINDIQNAKVWYTGGYSQFSMDYISPFMPASPAIPANATYPVQRFGNTIATPSTNLDFGNSGTCFYLEYDTTYFWLTYDIRNTATGGNFVDADFRESIMGGTGGCPSVSGGVSITPGTFVGPGAAQIDLPYCTPSYALGTQGFFNYNFNDYIHSTVLNGDPPTFINTGVQTQSLQPSVCAPAWNCHFVKHPPDYELMSSVPGKTVILTQGNTYSITVQVGTWFIFNTITAWIDWNRNGTFENSERLGQATRNALGTATWSFVVPNAAGSYTGPTRLRVREVFAAFGNIDPCATYLSGETEDYNITILPDCPVGYKLWLGNTDDWNDIANWCGGIPTLNDDVVIDRTATQINTNRPYYFPKIKSGVAATTKNINISVLDTVIIDAPLPASVSLKMKGDLNLAGCLRVNSTFTPDINYGNGTLLNLVMTPFKSASSDAKTQVIYTASELAAQGLTAGDQITALKFNITKFSSSAFNNFSVMWDHTAVNAFASANALVVTQTALPATSVSTVNGVNILNLTTPITWNGSSNIVIQYCFDNGGSIGASDDRILITQTTGRASTLILSSGNNGGSSGQGTSGCGFNSVSSGNIIANAGFFGPLSSYRPNTTFVINRPYQKSVIVSQADWNNNGNFLAGKSVVMMDSIVAQDIQGTSATLFNELQLNKGSSADYVTMQRDITVDSVLTLTQGQLRLNKFSLSINNSVQSAISRSNGFIISEDSLGKVNWNLTNVMGIRNFPFGHSSTNPLYIPLTINQTLAGTDLGVVTASTYYAPSNLPFPPSVNHLNNINPGTNNSAHTVDRYWIISKTGTTGRVDITFRYPKADRPASWSASGSVLTPAGKIAFGRAFPWMTYNSPAGVQGGWLRTFTISAFPTPLLPPAGASFTHTYFPDAAASNGVDSVKIAGYTFPASLALPGPSTGGPGNNSPWTLAGHQQATALPVTLVDFHAEVKQSKVKLMWTTLTEVDNDYFSVMRSRYPDEGFMEIGRIKSYLHTSHAPSDYSCWDLNPLTGLQYYKLYQTDLNGTSADLGTIPVRFGGNESFYILDVDYNSDGNITVEFFSSIEGSQVNYMVHDAMGKLITTGKIDSFTSTGKIVINQHVQQGLYFITLQSESGKTGGKFILR